MGSGPASASGARLAGDDYQHVLTWLFALKLLIVDGGVTKIEFEAANAGNVDDLIVHRVDEPTLYHQIKFVVSQAQPLIHDWFTTPPRGNNKSPLQRFYESYVKLTKSKGVPPEMALHTNRLPAPADPILQLVSGTDCKLHPRLAAQKPGSAAGKIRRLWAEHLGVDEETLLSFLSHLAVRAGRDGLNDLQEQCAWAMRAVGFRSDVASLLAAIGALRELIRTGVRELDAEAVQHVADTLELATGKPRATLLVQSLQADPWPETATASVDWVDLFDGDDAGSRRQLKDPAGWNERLKPELAAAVNQIRRARLTEVDVCGTMRLATGLLVGGQLSEVSGFRVAMAGREGEWASTLRVDEATVVERGWFDIGQGAGLAVAIAVSQTIGDDVSSYLRAEGLPVEKLVVYSPVGGPSRDSVKSPEAGVGLAAAVSRALREDTSSRRDGLHLFLSGPLPLAVMIGHFWNRMPKTQIYDDLGPGSGYAPTFII